MKYILIHKIEPLCDDYNLTLIIKPNEDAVKMHNNFLAGFGRYDIDPVDNSVHFFNHSNHYGCDFNHRYAMEEFEGLTLLDHYFIGRAGSAELSLKDVKYIRNKNDIALPLDKNFNKNLRKVLNEFQQQSKISA